MDAKVHRALNLPFAIEDDHALWGMHLLSLQKGELDPHSTESLIIGCLLMIITTYFVLAMLA